MEKDFGTLFTEIKKDVASYMTARLKLFRLDLFEKTSVAASVLLYGFTVMLILLFTLLFVFLALGFWLGELLESTAAGMALVALIYLIFLFLILINRTKIQTKLVDLFLKELVKDDEEDDEEDC